VNPQDPALTMVICSDVALENLAIRQQLAWLRQGTFSK